MPRFAYAESGGEPIYYDGCSHCLCVGITGSAKTTTANSLLWSMLVEDKTSKKIVVLNPKRVGFEWVTPARNVRLINDPAMMESVYAGLVDEMQRRYSALVAGGITEDELTPIYIFQDELAALLGGLLLPKDAKSIKENLQQLLILARQAKIFILAFTQTALGEFTGGTLTRANFSSTIMMKVTNSQELNMAANLSAEDISATMNPANFIRGEVLASTEAGRSFQRGMIYYRPPEQLAAAAEILKRIKPDDFTFLEKRGL